MTVISPNQQPDLDIVVQDMGTVWHFDPVSEIAKQWVDDNLDLAGWQWIGDCFAIDHRLASNVVDGMKAAGLKVKW